MIKWIFFDLGSTLLDEELAYREYTEECVKMLDSLGMDISVSVYRGKMEEFAREGLDPIRATWNHFAPNHPRPLWTNRGVKPYPETVEVLETLSTEYQLGIIANQASEVRDLLEEWRLLPYFQVLILSEEVGIVKPNKELFEFALKKAGISANEAIYVGDRYDNDILPATFLGMKTIRLMTALGKWMRENKGQKSDWQISSLSELVPLLTRKN